MKRTKRDIPQINQFEHDEESNAKRVKITDTAIQMELDHLDGDSVTAHPHKLSVSSMGVTSEDSEVIPELDCSSLKNVKLYIETASGLRDSTVSLMVSPVDSGDVWFTASSERGNETPVIPICARRLKVIQLNPVGDAELNVHLVGQG